MPSPVEILLHVARLFDELAIPYVVVGSFASSARGFPRATNDVDIVADIKSEHVERLLAALQTEFYVDELTVRRAVDSFRSFNAIHLGSVFKVDIFVPRPGSVGRSQLARRRLETILPEPPRQLYVATAEDMILAKLLWFREGGGSSEQQWADVLGIIKVQGEQLDNAYLTERAARWDVEPLLAKALAEALPAS